MAYNPFPVGYQAYYPQYQNPAPVQPTQQNGIIWVQGEAGAKSYLVAPNSTVQLWDSEKQTIYLKSADASGMPSMKILDYTVRDLSPANASVNPSAANTNYATKQDLKALYGRLEALESTLNNMEVKNDEQPASQHAQ